VHAAKVNLACVRAVANHVSGEDIFLGLESRLDRLARGIRDDAPAGETLAEIVIRVAFQLERDPAGEEAPEALTRRAGELEVDRVVGEPGKTEPFCDFTGERSADGAVGVFDF